MAPKADYNPTATALSGQQIARKTVLIIALEQIADELTPLVDAELVDELATCTSLVRRAGTQSMMSCFTAHLGAVAWKLDAVAEGDCTRAVLEAADALRQAIVAFHAPLG